MATIKVKFNKNADSTLWYVYSERKPDDPVQSKDCSDDLEGVIHAFAATRRTHNVEGGNQVVHVMQNFNYEDSQKHTVEDINKFGFEMAGDYFKGHEFVVVTHTDKRHVHNHIIVNAIALDTGKRIQNKKIHWKNLCKVNDSLARKYGYSIPNKSVQDRELKMPDKVYKMIKYSRNSYMTDMVQKIDFSKAYATSFDEFRGILFNFGINARIENENITFFYPGIKVGKRGKSLGKKYDKPGLQEAFKRNDVRFFKNDRDRALVEKYVTKALYRPDQIKELGSELQSKFAGLVDFGIKDYSGFTFIPRREEKQGITSKLVLQNSIVPMSEFRKASNKSIIDYCRKYKIGLEPVEEGVWKLKGRDYVHIFEYEWSNLRNRTSGNLIDFVASHKNVSFLQALADINGNKRLLDLERHFGQVKTTYKPFYIPKEDQLPIRQSVQELGFFLKSFGYNPKLADPFIRRNRVQVSKGGVIRWFSEKSDQGTFEFTKNSSGMWTSEKKGEFNSPFLERGSQSGKAYIFLDPFEFSKNSKSHQFEKAKGGNGLLVLMEPDSKVVDIFLARNAKVKELVFGLSNERGLNQRELDFFNNLKRQHEGRGITFGVASRNISVAERGRGIEI